MTQSVSVSERVGKPRPILFRPEMVRAILAGRKTVTRRPIRFLHDGPVTAMREHVAPHRDSPPGDVSWSAEHEHGKRGRVDVVVVEQGIRCPYGQVGDRLWVRETWGIELAERREGAAGEVVYRTVYRADNPSWGGKWRPSIHMPRKACRLVLEIVSVRAERLQDITEEDAINEGMNYYLSFRNRRAAFAHKWNEIHGQGAWESNPWVWRLEFKVVG